MTLEQGDRYGLASDVEVLPLDAHPDRRQHLLLAGGRQFAVGAGVAEVVAILRERTATGAELAAELERRGVTAAEPGGVAAVLGALRARGILAPLGGETAAIDTPGRPVRRAAYLTVQRRLLPAAWVRRLARPLQWLFHPLAAGLVLGSTLWAHWHFYARVSPHWHASLVELPLATYLLLSLAKTATTLFHELGHAAACSRYGAAVGDIGWAVYLYSPTFYTDVSSVWRLPRRRRALVALAGIYFETLAATLVLAAYLYTGAAWLPYLFVLLDLSMLASLNPVLRRDGYWFLSDLVGHTHLRDTSMRTVRAAVDRLLNRGTRQAPAGDSPRLRVFVGLYTLASAVFTVGLFYVVGRQVVADVLPALPVFAAALVAAGWSAPAAAAEALLRLALSLAFLALLAFSLLRFARFLLRWLQAAGAPGATEVLS